jgi:hypothetical protein
MRAYVDLCYEEWHLYKKKLVTKRTWQVWDSGIRVAFSRAAFRYAWTNVSSTSFFERAFVQYIESCIALAEAERLQG